MCPVVAKTAHSLGFSELTISLRSCGDLATLSALPQLFFKYSRIGKGKLSVNGIAIFISRAALIRVSLKTVLGIGISAR